MKTDLLTELIKVAEKFDSREENYLISYPYFINYFRKLKKIELENVVIGISFVYSWMPTILKALKISASERIVCLLNEVKNDKKLSAQELLFLKQSFNNSLVGTSKLLHFINPEKYAIWDSRVFSFLNMGEIAHKYKIEKPDTYFAYLDFINELKVEKEFHDFFTLMQKKVGYPITATRSIELAIFRGSPLTKR